MVAEIAYLSDLSWLSMLLLGGVLLSVLAVRMKISNLLLLLIVGVALGQTGWISFDQAFLTGFGIFALVMIIFDSTSAFKVREISRLSPLALKLAVIFLIVNSVILSVLTHVFFDGKYTLESFLISVLFAFMMSGTSPSTILPMLKDKKEQIAKLLEFESLINTPFVVILPLLVLSWFFGTIGTGEILITFTRNIMAGVGTGLVIGVVSTRIMGKKYLHGLSPLIVVALALVSYTVAENIGGNGVLSVTTLGLIFGWATLKYKERLKEFITLFSNFLTIVIFILLGLYLKIPTEATFLVKSLLLFMLFLLIRHISVALAVRGKGISVKERLFMTLGVSKGIGEAVIAFILIGYLAKPEFLSPDAMVSLKNIVNLSFLFIFYSILVSSVTTKFSSFFLD